MPKPVISPAPEWLDPIAQAEWDRVTAAGLITPTAGNTPTLAAYCLCVSRHREAESIISTEGTEVILRDDKGNVKNVLPSPQIGISIKYGDRMTKLARELGLTHPTQHPPRTAVRPPAAAASPSTSASIFGALPKLN